MFYFYSSVKINNNIMCLSAKTQGNFAAVTWDYSNCSFNSCGGFSLPAILFYTLNILYASNSNKLAIFMLDKSIILFNP
jgi:hypothetical protein